MSTQVEIGAYTLQVDSPAGTLIEEGDGASAVGGDLLRQAFEEPPPRPPEAGPAFATEVEEASEETAKIERAVSLGMGIGEGEALDPTQLGLEVGALLDCLERLDRKGKHKKSLQMARALATLLMLLKRWVDLLGTLRSALRAAEQLGDQDAIAWAKHELGTLRLAAGDLEGADRDLSQAREIRERIGDRRGLAATERNMAVLCRHLRSMLREEALVRRTGRGRLTPRLAFVACLFAFLFAAMGFAAGSLTGNSDSSSPSAAPDSSEVVTGPGETTTGPETTAETTTETETTTESEITTEPETTTETPPETEPTPEPAAAPEEEAFRAPR